MDYSSHHAPHITTDDDDVIKVKLMKFGTFIPKIIEFIFSNFYENNRNNK